MRLTRDVQDCAPDLSFHSFNRARRLTWQGIISTGKGEPKSLSVAGSVKPLSGLTARRAYDFWKTDGSLRGTIRVLSQSTPIINKKAKGQTWRGNRCRTG